MKVFALVIGNNNYGIKPLTNALNDAEAINEKFKLLGYDTRLALNLKSEHIGDILDEFADKIASYEAVIFYFAGHAFEIDSDNFLAAIDCPFNFPNNCKRASLPLKEILTIIQKAKTNFNIIILDSCRDNPFDTGRGFASNNLAPVFAPKGTLIAYSTSSGEKAKDEGFDRHSIYTGALLKHIDEKHLPIEDFFKRVRTTVYNLSKGTQTSWEHTSLIGDFCFNKGQLSYSLVIPYDKSVIIDRLYIFDNDSEIDKIIKDLKSNNYHLQNPAIDRLSLIKSPEIISKDQQFILGRNILQSCLAAFHVTNFMENIESNISRFTNSGENHLLNGILFEIYFDNNGNFRYGTLKKHCIEKIFDLQFNVKYKKSFEFIQDALIPYSDYLFYIPNGSKVKLSIDVLLEEVDGIDFFGQPVKKQYITDITVVTKNITDRFFNRYSLLGASEENLKNSLSDFLTIPKGLIQINSNINITNVYFNNKKPEL